MNLSELQKFLQTPQQVGSAEKALSKGDYLTAIKTIGTVEELSPEDITLIQQNPDAQGQLTQRLLGGGLIDISARTSRIAQLPYGFLAPVAYQRLGEALTTQELLPENSHYHSLSQSTLTNSEGNPINFGLEETRGTAQLLLRASELTGNREYAHLGICLLEQAVDDIETGQVKVTEPTVAHLIRFEILRARRLGGIGDGSLSEQDQYYRLIYEAANRSGNIDRARTVTARHRIDARRTGNTDVMERINQNLQSYDRYINNIQLREEIKEATQGIRRRAWSATDRFVSRNIRESVQDALVRIRENPRYEKARMRQRLEGEGCLFHKRHRLVEIPLINSETLPQITHEVLGENNKHEVRLTNTIVKIRQFLEGRPVSDKWGNGQVNHQKRRDWRLDYRNGPQAASFDAVYENVNQFRRNLLTLVLTNTETISLLLEKTHKTEASDHLMDIIHNASLHMKDYEIKSDNEKIDVIRRVEDAAVEVLHSLPGSNDTETITIT